MHSVTNVAVETEITRSDQIDWPDRPGKFNEGSYDHVFFFLNKIYRD